MIFLLRKLSFLYGALLCLSTFSAFDDMTDVIHWFKLVVEIVKYWLKTLTYFKFLT